MDPDATIDLLHECVFGIENLGQAELIEAVDYVRALIDWLDSGGFAPDAEHVAKLVAVVDRLLHLAWAAPDASAVPPPEQPDVAPKWRRSELQRHVEGALARTGRTYRIALDVLDETSLTELLRLLRDLEADRDAAVRRARVEPWRR